MLGGPTQGHGVSAMLRARLDELPEGALEGVATAAFDTRVKWPMLLSGSAAQGLAETLRRLGAFVVAPPESFLVTAGTRCGLASGELGRASAWARTLPELTDTTAAVM